MRRHFISDVSCATASSISFFCASYAAWYSRFCCGPQAPAFCSIARGHRTPYPIHSARQNATSTATVSTRLMFCKCPGIFVCIFVLTNNRTRRSTFGLFVYWVHMSGKISGPKTQQSAGCRPRFTCKLGLSGPSSGRSGAQSPALSSPNFSLRNPSG